MDPICRIRIFLVLNLQHRPPIQLHPIAQLAQAHSPSCDCLGAKAGDRDIWLVTQTVDPCHISILVFLGEGAAMSSPPVDSVPYSLINVQLSRSVRA